MRTAGYLITLCFICFAACWILNRLVPPAPTSISGEVIDWGTGRPAPGAEVWLEHLNSSEVVARTDAHGHFSFVAPNPPDVYFLFAGAPRYGQLMQVTFGLTVVVYRRSERVSNAVIPAIPATELSGHVYGADGCPIPGCDVEAITRRPEKIERRSVAEIERYALFAAQADDQQKFLSVESQRADSHGSYTFQRLGADRYFIVARCPRAEGVEDARSSWGPMVYPQASSIKDAKEIILLPGERRAGVDFHLQRERTYSFQGKVEFSDGWAPIAGEFSGKDLDVFRSDGALPSTWLGKEDCGWFGEFQKFRCSSLRPGTYTAYLGFDSHVAYFGKATFTVGGSTTQPPLTVRLHTVPEVQASTPERGPTGVLDVRKVCEVAVDGSPAIQVRVWGHRDVGGGCYFMTFGGKTDFSLRSGVYSIGAFEAALKLRDTLSFNGEPKLFELLAQRGTPVHIRVGQTSAPSVPVMSTAELINIALDSLRQSR